MLLGATRTVCPKGRRLQRRHRKSPGTFAMAERDTAFVDRRHAVDGATVGRQYAGRTAGDISVGGATRKGHDPAKRRPL